MAHQPTTPSRRSGVRWAILSALLLATTIAAPVSRPVPADAASLPVCGAGGTPAVTAVHNRHFYIDSGQSSSLFAQYAGYVVRAGAQGGEGLWVELSAFTGGIVRLADGQAPRQALPNLASGATTMAYFLLSADQVLASGGSGVPQTHTVTVYQGSPTSGGAPVCSRTYTYSDVRETIKALANKVQSISSSTVDGPAATLGDAVVITVQGNTGTLGAGPSDDPGVLDFTPNALADFPASAWRLERTELTISPNGSAPPTTYVDRLYLSGASGPARPYTARYTFRAVGPTSVAAQVKPIQYIASGTQVKHTDLGSTPLHLLPTVSPVANVWLSKAADPTTIHLAQGDATQVEYTLALSNVGGSVGTVDEVLDTPPAGATYVAGSARLDDGWIAEPDLFDGALVFRGPIAVPASGQARITYLLELGDSSGARTNTAVARYVQNQIDASRDVLHSEPASAVVRVRDLDGDAPEGIDDHVATTANTALSIDVLANDGSPSELELDIQSFTQPAASAGTVSRSGNLLVFTPSASFAGRTTFTYVVTDGTGSDTATVTVDVAPDANPDAYGGPPLTQLRTYPSVLGNDICPGCTVTLVSGPSSGTLVLRSNGTFDHTPASTQPATVTFDYRVTLPSAGGAPFLAADTDTATVTITLAKAAPDYVTTPYATLIDIAVRANDECSNCNIHSVSTDPVNGRALQLANPNSHLVRYSPYATVGDAGGAPSFWGIDRFEYTLTANGGVGRVTVLVGPPTLTITAVSGGPAANRNLATAVCDGCTLEFSLASAPAQGTVSITSSGTATYTPPSGWAGATSFTYTVREPVSGLSTAGTVNVTIGPEAVDDLYATTFGAAVTGDVRANDTCDGACTVTIVSAPATGTVDLASGGAFTFTPGTAVGDTTFTYRLASAAAPGVTSDATVTVMVSGATDDTATTDFATPVIIPVQTNDPCQICDVVAVSQPPVGYVTLEGDGTVTYSPPTSFSGRTSFTYTVGIGGGTSTATVTVEVRPAAVDDSVTTLRDTAVVVLPLTNDLCSNCSLDAVSNEANGTAAIRPDGRSVLFTPTGGFTGTASFAYTLVDGSQSTATATVTISVVAPPALVDDAVQTDADTPVIIDVLFNDDCAGCEVGVETDPNNGTVSLLVTGGILYQSGPGFSGIDTFTYRATDPATGAHGTATVTIIVAPTATDDRVRTPTNTSIDVEVQANDACAGCALTIEEPPPVQAGTASVVDGKIRLEPTEDYTGPATLTYRVTDPITGLSATAELSVEIDDAQPDAIATPHDTTAHGIDVLANDTCVDCAIVAVSTTAAGTPMTDGATIDFAPSEGFTGLAVFTYTAEPHGGGNAISSSVTVLVGPPDQEVPVPPDADADSPVTGRVLPDTDCVTCTFSLVGEPDHGEIHLDASGSYDYTPTDDEFGVDLLVYRVTDTATGVHIDGAVRFVPAEAGSLEVVKTLVGTDDSVTAPDGRVDAGDRLTYLITVTNIGVETLVDVAVADTLADELACDGAAPESPHLVAVLDVDESVDCTAVVTVTQTHLDTGSVTNVASASTDGGDIAAASNPVITPLEQTPALSLLKQVAAGSIGVATCATGHSELQAAHGDAVTWCFSVTNTGNVTFTSVAIDDPAIGLTPGDSPATLLSGSTAIGPGETMLLAAETAASSSLTNTATAEGTTASAHTATSAPGSSTLEVDDAPTTTTTTVAPTTTTTSTTVEPTTTTTTSTSTTTSTTVPPGGAPGTDSAVNGIVWFDRNENGRLDGGEWPLPGVVVTLTQVSPMSTTADAAVAGSHVTVTGTDGRYAFVGMAPGVYRITAAATIAGFSPRGNTHGGRSWAVDVELEAGQAADASYYGIGHGNLAGSVFESTSRRPTPHAMVACTWAGVDDLFGTVDDVEMTLAADRNGEFHLPGVPYGEFRCRGVDPLTGRSSTPANASVWSAELMRAELPIATLPRTGTDSGQLVAWALSLVMLGVGAVVVSRRPTSRQGGRRPPPHAGA